jgi:hypothetical protein
MVNTALRPDAGLAEILITRARASSNRRLALDLGLGVAIAAAVLVWRTPGWAVFLTAALCVASFGAWGIADRELHDAVVAPGPLRARALRIVRGGSVVVGTGAAAALIIAVAGIALGPRWTS